MRAERRYLLGPLERRGLVAGWRAGQVAVVAVGCALAGALVAISTSPPGIVAALVAVALGLASATIPLGGRTIDEWIPSLVSFAATRRGDVILDVEVVDSATLGVHGGIGVVRHRSGALSVTLALDSTGISLLEAEATDRRVDGFLAALGALAREGCGIDRIGWSASVAPDPGDQLVRDARRRGAGGVEAAHVSYRALLAASAPIGLVRRVELTLRISQVARRGQSPIAVLLEEVQVVSTALEDAGHRRCRLLDRDELRDRLGLGATMSGDDDSRLRVMGTSRFDSITVADRSIVTWWVAGWPRNEVTAELLAPLLLGGVARSMAVVFEPVAPSAALRRAASARTSEIADAEIRRRGGFLADRRQQRQREHTESREAELVDGHGSLRVSGFVAVSAHEREELERAVAETELAAAQTRLELRRLQGDHVRGVVATLPLAAGLP